MEQGIRVMLMMAVVCVPSALVLCVLLIGGARNRFRKSLSAQIQDYWKCYPKEVKKDLLDKTLLQNELVEVTYIWPTFDGRSTKDTRVRTEIVTASLALTPTRPVVLAEAEEKNLVAYGVYLKRWVVIPYDDIQSVHPVDE